MIVHPQIAIIMNHTHIFLLPSSHTVIRGLEEQSSTIYRSELNLEIHLKILHMHLGES